MDRSRLQAFADAARTPFTGPPPEIVGSDPVYRYPLAIGEAAATAHALCADAALAIWERGHGSRPEVRVDVRAAAASLAGASIQLLEGTPLNDRQWEPGDRDGVLRPWGSMHVLRGENATNPVVGLYRCRDDRWIHIHGGAPHLADRIMKVLGGEKSIESITRTIAGRESYELEDALAAAETCGAVARTEDEWAAHPQGLAVAPLAAVEIVRSGDDTSILDLEPGSSPLAGVRVLDLGDGLAGPLCGRTLARYGADVLQIVSPNRGFIEPFVLDTGFGKRSTSLDLSDPTDSARFGELLSEADVLCQSFRPGVLDSLGYPAEVRHGLNPSLVTVSINCYGPVGPWSGRRGWEQLGQIATGLSLKTSLDGVPRLAPATLCDCLTGLLAASGTMRALHARSEEGGAWDVLVSLCQTAMWISRMQADVDEYRAPIIPDFTDLLVGTELPIGRLWHPGPAVEIEGMANEWPKAPPALGRDEAGWIQD